MELSSLGLSCLDDSMLWSSKEIQTIRPIGAHSDTTQSSLCDFLTVMDSKNQKTQGDFKRLAEKYAVRLIGPPLLSAFETFWNTAWHLYDLGIRFEAKSRIRNGKTPGRSVWACCAFAQSSYLHHEVIPFRHVRRPTGCNSIVSDRVLMVTGHFQ
jgi:hypothetical protein